VGLLAILTHSVVDFNMHIPANAILTVTIMALVSAHYRFASERWWHTVRWPLRVPVYVALAAALVYLVPQTWRRTVELHWLSRADGITKTLQREGPNATPARLAELGRDQLILLEKACRGPRNLRRLHAGRVLRQQASPSERPRIWPSAR
jgi:hypothetical protein